MLFWLPLGIVIGVVFAESFRAVWRKITKGRAFGPVPAKDTLDLTEKAPPQ